jgi:KDO2-lipid IV(A) lauroyltransferase
MKDRVLYLLFRIIILFVLIFPSKLRWRIGMNIGLLARILAPARNGIIINNLIHSGYSPQEAAVLAPKIWTSLGLVGAEFIYYLIGYPKRLKEAVNWVGKEIIDEALAHGKGAIIVCAHLGNWELLGAALSYEYPIVGIAMTQDNSEFDVMINKARTRGGARVVPKKALLKPIITALRHNELAFFLVDQRGPGVHCEFMGRETSFYAGAATFALRTGAVLIPARLIRVEPGSFVLKVDRPIVPSTDGSDDENIKCTTIKIIKVIEEQVRHNPEQWLWMHKLWRE